MQNTNLIEKYDLAQKGKFNAHLIGWLVNPNGNHNLGYGFLEDFLFLINEKADLNSDVTVKTNYKVADNSVIDILIETNDSIYAVKCGDMNDNSSHGNLLSYKEYVQKDLKSDKKLTCVYISIAPFEFGNKEFEYIKNIRYYEIAEILPDNLTGEEQQIINQFSDIIQEKSVKYIYQKYSDEDINEWKKLNKSGKIVRQIAKYFSLKFTYKLFRTNIRRYAINADKDLFMLFSCVDNNLHIRIQLLNKDSDRFSKITDKAKNLGLSIKKNCDMLTLQELVLPEIDRKSVEELAKTIELSSILENYLKLYTFMTNNGVGMVYIKK